MDILEYSSSQYWQAFIVQGPREFGGHRLISLNDIYFWELQIPCYQDMGMKLVKAVQFFLYYVIMVNFPLFLANIHF